MNKQELRCSYEIQKLARLTYTIEKKAFKVNGISTSQAYTLLELFDKRDISMKVISKKMALDTSTMTRNIAILIKLGLVRRSPCHLDKRVIRINLTDLGKAKTKEIRDSFINIFKKNICDLSKSEYDSIFEGVHLLSDSFEAVSYD